MPRLPRVCPPGIPVHVTQRGHNRQICFASSTDFATYARRLKEAAQKSGVNVHAWVFMTNHVHLLVTPAQDDALSSMMQRLNRNYVGYYNKTYQRSGTLWDGRVKACLVEAVDYLLHCYRYIELNPVRAGMVADPADYPWSSYRSNALGVPSSMLSPHPEYLALANHSEERLHAYRELFKHHISAELLQDIRDATNRNLALGSARFKKEIEATLGRRVVPAKPGRK